MKTRIKIVIKGNVFEIESIDAFSIDEIIKLIDKATSIKK